MTTPDDSAKRSHRVHDALEVEFVRQVEERSLPHPERQSRKPWDGTKRLFRADFLWEDARLVLEVDGGTWVGGRHTRGAGYARDCEKLALATINGYTVLKATASHVRDGTAIGWVEALLKRRQRQDE